MHSLRGQLTLRGVIIGCVGCIIITAASAYTALKMGALPWPIIFAAIISLFFLKALGHTNLHEANVTHTVMSAGAMVAGGLAFTIPGAWMLGYADQIDWWQLLIVALAGVILGLIYTALLRKHFIETAKLEYPIGEAAAQTLIAGDTGGSTGKKLFGSMGLAGIYCALRDGIGVIPGMLLGNITIPGVAFGIYNSPMLIAIGFLVGTTSILVWFAGALIGNIGIIVGGSAAGLWDIVTAQGITSSLGMGVMMGCGVGVIVKNIVPKGIKMIKDLRHSQTFGLTASSALAASTPEQDTSPSTQRTRPHMSAGLIALALSAVALLVSIGLGLGPIPSIVIVLLTFVTTAMSAQSVGQTGIDPMEIFGLIALLIIAAFAHVTQVQLFFVAGIIAVACGLTGDVMNDFKAGHVLGTDPRAQWIGQAIGGILGAFIAVAVMIILISAYGAESFGPQGSFVAAQASVVATMVAGIPSVPAFLVGLGAGCLLYLAGMPSMMLGLGIYLPFYLSFTAFLGAMVKVVFDTVSRHRLARLSDEDRIRHEKAHEESGLIMASGLLGGESVVGVLIALSSVFMGLGAS